MNRCRRQHPSLVDDSELGRATADIDIQDPLAAIVSQLHGSRAMRGEHRLHVMAGRRTHEVAALL